MLQGAGYAVKSQLRSGLLLQCMFMFTWYDGTDLKWWIKKDSDLFYEPLKPCLFSLQNCGFLCDPWYRGTGTLKPLHTVPSFLSKEFSHCCPRPCCVRWWQHIRVSHHCSHCAWVECFNWWVKTLDNTRPAPTYNSLYLHWSLPELSAGKGDGCQGGEVQASSTQISRRRSQNTGGRLVSLSEELCF